MKRIIHVSDTAKPPFTLDPAIRNIIPPLLDAEREGLEADIRANGCRDMLVAWDRADGAVLIDGHNRFAICTQWNVPYDVLFLEFESQDDVTLWVINNQMHRRNLDALTRIELATRKANILAERAAERKAATQSKPGEKVGRKVGPNSAPPTDSSKTPLSGKTDTILAAEAGVSRETLQRGRKVLASGDQKTIQAVKSGKKSINKAFQELAEAEAEESEQDDRITDAEGTPVPASLLPIFTEMDAVLEGCRRGINDLSGRLDPFNTDAFGLGAWLKVQEFERHLDNLKRLVKFARPHSVCPRCKGAAPSGCKPCRGTGWLNAETAKALKEKAK